MDAIFKRRSIRRFTGQDVSEDSIKKVLAAGMSAPSAGNEQPWHFILIKDKEALRKLSECGPYAKAVAGASAGILVCADLSLQRHKGYWVHDCSAAVENMLVEATELGLGAVWLGVHPEEDRIQYLAKYFVLPEQIIPFAMVPLGYPAQELSLSDRYNQSRVHYEKW